MTVSGNCKSVNHSNVTLEIYRQNLWEIIN